MSFMLEICSEFAMISIRGKIERQLCPLFNLIQCAFSIALAIEIIANSLQISNIKLIFTKYSKPAFTIFCYNDTYSSTCKLYNLFYKSLIEITIFATIYDRKNNYYYFANLICITLEPQTYNNNTKYFVLNKW